MSTISQMSLKSFRNRLQNSPFARNVLVLATGTALGQIIGILSSPITRRLYSPEEYGLFTLVAAISAICTSVSCGRYEMGIMLPKEERKAVQLVWLSSMLCVATGIILFVAILFFHQTFANWLRTPKVAIWLFLIPFMVVGKSVYGILYNFNNRIQNYKDISKTQLTRAIALATISIGLGVALPNSVVGLMIAGTVATYLGIGLLNRSFLKSNPGKVNAVQIKEVAREYKKFPQFSVWAGLANTLSSHLLDIFILVTFSTALLGQYSLTKLVCGMPTILLGTALSQVFYQRIVHEKHNDGNCERVFLQTVTTLSLLSLLAFGTLYLIAEPAINFVFSDRWSEAASFTTILIPFYAIRFVSSAAQTTTSAFERQEITLTVNLVLLISLVLVMVAQSYFALSITQSLTLYAVLFSLDYFFFMLVNWNIIRQYESERR